MSDPGSLMKPTGACPCGGDHCVGVLNGKRFDGQAHARGCSCKRCKGHEAKRAGDRAARRHKWIAGISSPSVNEETWNGPTRQELKSAEQVRTHTRFLNLAWSQANTVRAKAIGDERPTEVVLDPDDGGPVWVCRREDETERVVGAYAQSWEWI